MRHGCQQCRLQARCKSKNTFRRHIFNLHLLKGGSGVIVSVYLLNVNFKKKRTYFQICCIKLWIISLWSQFWLYYKNKTWAYCTKQTVSRTKYCTEGFQWRLLISSSFQSYLYRETKSHTVSKTSSV